MRSTASKMCRSSEEWGQKAGTGKVERRHPQHSKTRIYSHTFALVKGSQAHLAQITQSQAPERVLRVLPLRSGQVNWVGVRKWALSRWKTPVGLSRGLAAVVGTMLVDKLLLAEGREAIGSRLRENFYALASRAQQNRL